MNAEERWVRVEPGIVLDELNAHLAPTGLRFAPDISTASRATIGGMMGNNSSGARSVLYGKTIDHVLEQTVALLRSDWAPSATVVDLAFEAGVALLMLSSEEDNQVAARVVWIAECHRRGLAHQGARHQRRLETILARPSAGPPHSPSRPNPMARLPSLF